MFRCNLLGLVVQPTLFKAPFFSRTRYSSAVDLCSLVKLASDIDLVYPYLEDNNDLNLSSSELANIKDLIVSDKYSLSHLEVHYVNNKYGLRNLLMDNLMDYPDAQVDTCTEHSQIFSVVTPKMKEDALVLRALSLTLLRLSQGSLPKDCFQLEDLLSSVYDRLKEIGKANRIYKINFEPSKRTIPIRLVEETILSLVGDSSVFKLIWSFIHLPILDFSDINGKGLMSICGIPSVGEITKVLFHMTLLGILDREFPIRFPGIQFSFFHNEAYIFTKEKEIFDEKALHKLLEDHCLLGKIESMGPCDKPLLCYSEKRIYLGTDSQVELCDYSSYLDSHSGRNLLGWNPFNKSN